MLLGFNFSDLAVILIAVFPMMTGIFLWAGHKRHDQIR